MSPGPPATERWLALDTSAAGNIAKLGYLPQLATRINLLITPAVAAELRDVRNMPSRAEQPQRTIIPDQPYVRELAPRPEVMAALKLGLAGLDPGETETIALARSYGGITVGLDDAAARSRAVEHGVNVTGVVGIVAALHRAGLATRSPEEDLRLLLKDDPSYYMRGMRLTPTVREVFFEMCHGVRDLTFRLERASGDDALGL
jgi:predicted nucleic acid-binding protein